jgi:hypothetical protein
MSQFSPGKAVTHFLSAALGPRRTNMAKSERPSEEHYAKHYPAVMRCAGLSASKKRFERDIRTIFGSYWAARDQLTIAEYCEVLERCAKGLAIAREALRLLEPIYGEIKFAAQLLDIPQEDRQRLIALYFPLRARTRHKSKRIAPYRSLDGMTAKRERAINLLKNNPDLLAQVHGRQRGGYRKDNERALVVEPALDLLETIGFRQSRELTRKAFFNALFDLIGIEKKRRPSHRSIDVTASNRRAALKRQSK